MERCHSCNAPYTALTPTCEYCGALTPEGTRQQKKAAKNTRKSGSGKHFEVNACFERQGEAWTLRQVTEGARCEPPPETAKPAPP